MADIFQEIDEDLRRDRSMALWRRWRVPLAAGCVAIVLGAAGGVWWREHEAATKAERGDRFTAAAAQIEAGQAAEGEAALLALADEAGRDSGYGVLALMRAAAAREAAGNATGAVELLDQVANGKGDASLRDVARLKAAMLVVDSAEADAVIGRVDPLIVPTGAWRHAASLIKAGALLRKQDEAAARTLLDSLSKDESAPRGVRQQATELLASLGGPGPQPS
ncbi:tetratricopeptide repeat protein [Zavarzinia sp. CC-PAN008]|uniref:tetratricopeptide repeat protein n=1 Tax=Zavarzinia sp. CC-PAN008 TaxID=3243332 RepID=UPI003F7422DA